MTLTTGSTSTSMNNTRKRSKRRRKLGTFGDSVVSISKNQNRTQCWSFPAFCCVLFLLVLVVVNGDADISWRHLDEGNHKEENDDDVDVDFDNDDDHLHLHITKSHQLSVVGVGLGWTGSFFCIAAWIFVCTFRRKPIVALGQPPFLGLICAGSLLLASVNVLARAGGVLPREGKIKTSTSLNDCLCIVRMWFFDIGIVVVYMAFFCKLWRAEQVCQFRKKQAVHVHHVIGPFFLILLVEIGILIGQTIVAPPHWSREVPLYPRNPEKTDAIEKCYQYQLGNPTNMAFNASTSAVRFLCQGITIWMSYKTRKIREDISDSRRIFQTVVFQILLSVPFVLLLNGVLVIDNNGGSSIYVFEFMYSFLLAVSSVGFLILPKIHCVYYEQRHGSLPAYARTVGGVHVSTTIALTTNSNSNNNNNKENGNSSSNTTSRSEQDAIRNNDNDSDRDHERGVSYI